MSHLENQQVSSKAGRHRLYSNEQRKDRNRQAQAAFRDRRSKYTKTLEVAILKFEETIELLKETNKKSIERAEVAEERCSQLDSEVASLQKLLQLALVENQRLLQNNVVLPVSPPFNTPEIIKLSPAITTTTTTATSTTDFLFSSLNDQTQQPFVTSSSSSELFDTTWLNQPPTTTTDHNYHYHHYQYIFTDNQQNEFCLDIL